MESEPLWSNSSLWTAILATGVASTFLTFTLTWIAELVRARFLRHCEARYAAMRCAVALERFAAECWHSANISEGHFSMTQEAFAESLPAAPSIPEDLNWKALGFGLADEVLSFVTSLRLVESQATYARIFEGNPYDFDDAVKRMGLRAINISAKLRGRYGMENGPEHDQLVKGLGRT